MIAVIVALTAAITLYALLKPKPGRTCSCGRQKRNAGFVWKCEACDFDPDTRP